MSEFTKTRAIPAGPTFDTSSAPHWYDSVVMEHAPTDGDDILCEVREDIYDRPQQSGNAELIATAFNAAICAEEMGYDGVRAVSGCDVHIRLLRDALEILSDFNVIDAQTTADEIRSTLAQARKED